MNIFKLSIRILVVAGLIILLCFTSAFAASSESIFEPIMPNNALQLQLIDTLENYRKTNDYRVCDIRFFSTNGRTLATDWKVADLVSNSILDFRNRGYPLALSPDGFQAVVSGQKTGTRLVDVESGQEQMLTPDDAESATYNPNGKVVVLSSRDADGVQIWDVGGRKLLTTLGRSNNVIRQDNLRFTRDGSKLIWKENDSILHVWDVKSQTDILRFDDVWNYELSSDETSITFKQWDFKTVQAWDIVSSKQLASIIDTKEQSGANAFALSPDKTTLAIGYFGGNERTELWKIATQPYKLITHFDKREDAKLQFTPDSKYLILAGGSMPENCDRENGSGGSGSGRWTDDIQFINAKTGEVVSKTKLKDGVWDSSLISGGHLLLTAKYFGPTQLWHLDDTALTPITTLNGSDFILSPEGSTLITELDENFIAIYGIPSDKRPIKPYVLPGNTVPTVINVRAEPNSTAEVIGKVSGQVRVQGRSEDGKYLYLPDSKGWVRSDATYIRLVDDIPVGSLSVYASTLVAVNVAAPTPTPTPIATLTPTPVTASSLNDLQIHIGEPIIQPALPTDGLSTITAENSSSVALLGVLPDSFLRADTYPVLIPEISTDGMYLVSPPTKSNQYARIWNLHTLTSINGPHFNHSEYGSLMAVSPDAKTIAYSLDNYNQPLMLWSKDHPNDPQKVNDVETFGGYGRLLAFSPDSQHLVYQGTIIDVPSSKKQVELDNAGSFAFTAKGDKLAVVAGDRVYIYDTQSYKLIGRTTRVTLDMPRLEEGKFSPDGNLIVATTSKGLEVYDTQSGQALYSLPLVEYDNNWGTDNISFSADAQTMAVLYPNGLLSLYQSTDGRLIGTYDVGQAQGFAFSPDGKLLAIGNPLRIINLEAGKGITIAGNYGGSYLAFTPDGSSILVDGADNSYDDFQSVMVFGVPTDDRPAWSSISAHVIPQGINVRAEPSANGKVIGFASGDVQIVARDSDGQAVYLAKPEGWIWSAAEYLNLNPDALLSLPIRTTLSGQK